MECIAYRNLSTISTHQPSSRSITSHTIRVCIPAVYNPPNKSHHHTCAYTYDRTLENQNGRSFLSTSGVASPLAICTES